MNTHNYAISTLTDYSRLDEVYRLTHDTLVEVKHLVPRADGEIISFHHLDISEQTTILVAQHTGRVVGTISVSDDGPDGLMSDKIFEAETERIRRQTPHGLGSTWRMATSDEYRSERSLVINLIKSAFFVCFEHHIDTCLILNVERHTPIYKRMLGAEIVAKGSTSLDGMVQINVALMKLNVLQAWKRFMKVAKV